MRLHIHKKLLLMGGVIGLGLLISTPAGLAQGLPTYEDFRRVDRARRATGQLQTAELMKVTQIDRGLIQRTALWATNDFQVVWGAAELMGGWTVKRTLFESALAASGS